MWRSRDRCLEIILFVYIGTQHPIVSVTQTQTPQIIARRTESTHCQQNESEEGEEEGVSLHQGGEDEEHVLSGAALSSFDPLLDSLLTLGLHADHEKHVCTAFSPSRNPSANNIAAILYAPADTTSNKLVCVF